MATNTNNRQNTHSTDEHHSSLATIQHKEKDQLTYLRDLSEKQRMKRINKDFHAAFKLLQANENTVTFFGSARFKPTNGYYKMAEYLAERLAEELEVTIISGGGPGIMEAANHGAVDGNGKSVGMTIQLPHEQVTNRYVKQAADFYYFFSRKVALAFAARAFVFFPGGFGTLDEFFEILTLMQTNKIPKIPVVLYGTEFWEPLLEFIETTLYEKNATIDDTDMQLYVLTDDLDEIINIVANSTYAP